MGRAFLASFLAGDPAARAFLPLDFRDPATRVAQVRRASARRTAAPVLEALAAQEAELPPSPARRGQLEALGQPGTTAVITGQQVGLFLGPLYTFYKAATAVAAARALERESGVRCVPVFWLQTEDHDFPEVDHCHVLGADGAPRRLTIDPGTNVDPRVSLAHRRLGPDVERALAELADVLGAAPSANEVLALLRAHYRTGAGVAQAFAGALAELFADDGLLVFNPRVPAVARRAAALYRRVLDDHQAITGALDERARALKTAGFDPQIPPRKHCSLLFFHDGSALGPRYRLQRKDAADGGVAWSLTGTGRRVGDDELGAALADDPLRFSTSALLRPLLQDTLFPTAATVGGPAELAYFAQLGPLYDLFALPPPLAVLRARFRCVDGKARGQLQKLGLRPADLEHPPEVVARALAETLASPDIPSPKALAAEIDMTLAPVLERLSRAVTAADATLSRPAERTGAHLRLSIDKLMGKYAQAVCRRDQVAAQRLDRLRAALYPEQTPQERYYGWASIAARTGRAAFARAVHESLVPFSPDIAELCP
jgi:bacillithiol biosynthesis cysteine-adding enzyme BshC